MSEIKPIARWARVPNEVLSGMQQIGLVAFHKDGIKEVQYTVNDGTSSTNHVVIESKVNHKTKIEEYSFDFDFDSLPADGSITVSAKVIANDGSELVFDRPYSSKDAYIQYPAYGVDPIRVCEIGIHSITLEKPCIGKTYKVSVDGNDSNDGINAPSRHFRKHMLLLFLEIPLKLVMESLNLFARE